MCRLFNFRLNRLSFDNLWQMHVRSLDAAVEKSFSYNKTVNIFNYMLRVIGTGCVRKLYMPDFRRRNYENRTFCDSVTKNKIVAYMAVYFKRQVFFWHISPGMSYDTVNSNGKKNTCYTRISRTCA